MKKIFKLYAYSTFPFHLVTLSPWPFLTSMNLMFMMMGMIKMFNFNNKSLFLISFFTIIICSYQWWRDTSRESTFQGTHTLKVLEGLKLGMMLFIISEIFFFISFFWSYFHMFLSPSIEIGNNWPPTGLTPLLINPYNLPLLNTIILISSGMFLSTAHYTLILKNFKMTNLLMMITIILGLIFTYIQGFEYIKASYTINYSNYGTLFFMMTGFHGIHVILGTIFIMTSWNHLNNLYLSNLHHFSFEASAWYWHFVDVVWLFLFLFLYWWPY